MVVINPRATSESIESIDWFSEHIPAWRAELGDRLKGAGAACLFVGPFDGRCVEWTLKQLRPKTVTVLDNYGAGGAPNEAYQPCVFNRGVATVAPAGRALRDALVARLTATGATVVVRTSSLLFNSSLLKSNVPSPVKKAAAASASTPRTARRTDRRTGTPLPRP
jgi:hypothetical protein